MRAISSFKLYENVPAFGSAAFEGIASKTQPPLAVGFVKTILRYTMTNGIFREPSPGHVFHSGLSLLLLKDPLARAFVNNNADGVFPSTAEVAEALRKWSEAEGPSHTGLQLTCGTEKSMFEWYASGIDETKGRMETFAGSMRYWSSGEDFLTSRVVNGFDWASLPKDAVVVDGNPNLRLPIQDLPGQIQQSLTEVKENHTCLVSSGRLDFKSADFFAPQPSWMDAESVGVYFMYYILHDWNDEYCIKILKNRL